MVVKSGVCRLIYMWDVRQVSSPVHYVGREVTAEASVEMLRGRIGKGALVRVPRVP